MRRRLGGIVVLALIVGACSRGTAAPITAPTTAAPPATTTTDAARPPLDEQLLQSALDEWSEAAGSAGVSAAVRRPDGTSWVGAAGLADEGTGRAVVPGDTFRIGSITKTFAAAVVLQLAEEGVVGLDEPVAGILPDLGLDPAITVRHVLGHRSGLRDGLEEAVLGGEPADPALVMLLSTRGGLLFDPGTRFDYCNANYILVALLVEAVVGAPAHESIRDRILDPLRLDGTFMAGFEPGIVTALPDGDPQQAEGYEAFDLSNSTAGAMASTASDLAGFVAALFGGALLEPATIQAMVTPGDSFGEGAGYGLGVELTAWAEREAWGHRGGVRGYLSAAFFFPEDGTSIAVVSNAWRAGDVWELFEVLSALASQ